MRPWNRSRGAGLHALASLACIAFVATVAQAQDATPRKRSAQATTNPQHVDLRHALPPADGEQITRVLERPVLVGTEAKADGAGNHL